MITEQDEFLIASLFQTELWGALKRLIKEEIGLIEVKEEFGSKICNDPLNDDFRVQLGIKIGLKRILRIPEEITNNIKLKGDSQ